MSLSLSAMMIKLETILVSTQLQISDLNYQAFSLLPKPAANNNPFCDKVSQSDISGKYFRDKLNYFVTSWIILWQGEVEVLLSLSWFLMKCFVHSCETKQRIATVELIVGHGTFIIKPEAETFVINGNSFMTLRENCLCSKNCRIAHLQWNKASKIINLQTKTKSSPKSSSE